MSSVAQPIHSPEVRGHWGILLLGLSLLQGLPMACITVSLENHTLSSLCTFAHTLPHAGKTSSLFFHVQKAYLPQGLGQTIRTLSPPQGPARVTQL